MSAEFEKELGTQGFDDIVNNTLESIIQKDVGLTNINPGSVLRTLVEVLAENEDTQNYYVEYVYKCMNIDNCVGDDLDKSAKILGFVRKPAKPAIGEVTFYTGDSPAGYDINIPYGYIVSTRPDKNGNVIEFSVNENAVLKAGSNSVTVTVVCTKAAQININKSMISVLTQSLQGISYVSNEYVIDGGDNIESDEDFLTRIRTRDSFGRCTDYALKSAVDQISGVTSAIVIDQYNGIGTTAVIAATDQVPPPQSVKDEIARVIASTKASGIRADIIYTTIKGINIEINIANTTSIDYPNIIDAINAYCRSLVAGQSFIIKQMERKILNIMDNTVAENDDLDIQTLVPSTNITANMDQIIRPTSIKINGTIVV